MSHASIREGFKLLRKPAFARLFFAYLTTHYGNAMAPIAMAFGVLELTGSTRDSAYVIAASVLAQVMMLLLSGALADRTSRQTLMVLGEATGGVVQLSIAILFLSGYATVPVLAFLMLLLGAAFATSSPSATGFLPQVVAREELQAANALLAAARNSAHALGAAIAGLMVATLGAGITIGLDAITFIVAAWLIKGIHARSQDKTSPATLLEDLRLGWKEFIRHQWLWAIVLQFSFLVAASEAVYGLLGPAVTRLHMSGAVDWGLIAASSGLGTIVGGLVAMRIQPARPMLFASCLTFFFAGTSFALSVPLQLIFIACAAFVAGVAGQIFGVIWYTTLQKEIPSHMLSRVSAYDHLGSLALAPLGIVAGGLMFETIGSGPTLLIAGSTIVVSAILVLLVPGVRNLRASPATAPV